MYYPLHELLSKSPYFSALPSKKEEKWRFSSLHKYLDKQYKNTPGAIDQTAIKEEENFIQIRDGQLVSHKLPLGVHISEHPLSFVVHNNPFSKLASCSAPSPVELNIFEDTQINIYSDYCADGFLTSNINLILQEGVSAKIYILFEGGENCFISHASHIKLEKDSKLFLSEVQKFSQGAVFISQQSPHLHENSYLQNFSLLYKGEYLHHFIQADLAHNSQMDTSSLLLSTHQQNLIFSCDINHLSDRSKSNVLSKQVLRDKSTCVFDANTKIYKDTHQTEAKQSTKGLLLSETAQIHSKPHLEIYSDDLTASHGSTVGELDTEAIAYLLSRGISLEKAKAILISAFIHETIDTLEVKEHQENILGIIGEYYE